MFVGNNQSEKEEILAFCQFLVERVEKCKEKKLILFVAKV